MTTVCPLINLCALTMCNLLHIYVTGHKGPVCQPAHKKYLTHYGILTQKTKPRPGHKRTKLRTYWKRS
jgi:hypothetical protein